MAHSLNSKDTFAFAIKAAFKYWSVLQISREHGFGGRNSFAKEEWLYDSVLQIFTENGEMLQELGNDHQIRGSPQEGSEETTVDNVFAEELEDFISEAIFNEFDTVVEDGSLNVLCRQLCGFYEMCNNQQHQKVLEEIKRLESVARNVPIVAVSDSDESDEESSMNFERPPDNNELISERITQEQEMEIETNDGSDWEIVRRSKKR